MAPVNELVKWLTDLVRSARCWQVVQPWERGVRVRGGKQTTLWGPGIHFRIPLLDMVRVVNTRLRIAAVPCQTVSTSDRIAVTCAALVAFRIVDPLAAMLRLHNPESCAAAFVQSAIAAHVGRHSLAALTAAGIEEAALDAVRKLGDGFVFETVSLVDFAAVRTLRLLQENWRPHTGDGGGGL
jgi:regulator of protease activity HflC (stomatin/prohibitin superfamily)